MHFRTKLALWYSGLLTLIIVIFSVAVIAMNRVTILQPVDRWLGKVAQSVVDHIELQGDAITFGANDILHTPGVTIHLWQIADVDTGNPIAPKILFDSMNSEGDIDPIEPAGVHTKEMHINTVIINDVPERVVSLPVRDDNDQIYGIVQISTPIHSVSQANRQILLVTIISAVVCISISILLGIGLSNHLLKPVKAITNAASSVANADALSTRLEWRGPRDELGELTEVFNEMMERLERLFYVQQRFIGDISHELRTPLTTIHGELELMLRYKKMDEQSVDAVYREAKRMMRMVEDLLLLSRADYGDLLLEFYPFDLDTVAVSAYEDTLRRSNYHKGITIAIDNIQPVPMEGNGERIRQVISILLHNAIKFTPEGGTVTLKVYSENDSAIIEVQDTGIGISSANQAHIFDRFFQVDTSRVHRDESDGAGLGLSIADWIIKAHNGKIDVQSEETKGAIFKVTLPLKQDKITTNDSGLDDTDIATLKIKTRPASHKQVAAD